MTLRSAAAPLSAAVVTAFALGLGYRYAAATPQRNLLPASTHAPATSTPHAWPGTTLITGTLIGYKQRVMSVRAADGSYAVILALSTVVLPTCGRRPTLQPGEALEVRAPVQGDGTLLAVTVRAIAPCPR